MSSIILVLAVSYSMYNQGTCHSVAKRRNSLPSTEIQGFCVDDFGSPSGVEGLFVRQSN